MNFIEDLQKLKKLFDEGALTEKEFTDMKNEMLINRTKNSPIDDVDKIGNSKTGILSIRFEGQWFLFDVKTKLFVNHEFHSSHSTKNGFNVDIPISSNKIFLKVVLAGFRSTTYEIEDLDPSKNYIMELTYSDFLGKYSNNFNLRYQINENEVSEKVNTTHRSKNGYFLFTMVVFLFLGITLPFHYVPSALKFFPKDHFTFKYTIITEQDLDDIIKRYNNASNVFEQNSMNNDPLIKSLKEQGIIYDIEKKDVGNEN